MTDYEANSAATLAAAVQTADRIRVTGHITDAPTIHLRPGQSLTGGSISFAPGSDGVVVSTDNELSGITLAVDPVRRAIRTDPAVAELGRLQLEDVRTTGQVALIAEGETTTGRIEIDGLRIEDVDTTTGAAVEAFGVAAIRPGALTVWNRQLAADSELVVRIDGVRIGEPDAPVSAAGVVIIGGGDSSGRMDPRGVPAGRIQVEQLTVDDVFADGQIPAGTDNLISGGVLILYGVHAAEVWIRGDVTTYGVNDMVIDNWADTEHLRVDGSLRSYGASAIGVVNFGVIQELRVDGPIRTRGTGARGFNHYLGRIEHAEFAAVETHGDGAMGIQISHAIGTLVLHEGITTHGGTGPTLVRGELVDYPAIALSILPEATITELRLGGPLQTTGPTAARVEGHVGRWLVDH